MVNRICLILNETPKEKYCRDVESISFDGLMVGVNTGLGQLLVYPVHQLKSFDFTYGDIKNRKTVRIIENE